MLPHSKGQAQMVSLALYSAIIVVGVSTVVFVGQPILEDMQDVQAVDTAKDMLTDMEEQVRAVARAGEGSQTTVGLQFQRGEFVFDEDTDEIRYRLNTDVDIIQPHSTREIGGLQLSSLARTTVEKDTVNGQDCWRMRNDHISACIRKIPETASEQIGTDTAGYWRFDGSGGVAADSSTHGNDGSLENGTGRTDGLHDGGVQFDGEDDYVEVPDDETLNVTDAVTVSAWVYSEEPLGNTTRMDWVSKSGAYVMRNDEREGRCDIGAPGPMFHVQMTDGNFYGVGYCGAAAPSAREWHHFVGVFNASDRGLEFWANGELVDVNRSVTGMTMDTSTDPMTFGAHAAGANYFNGTMDEIRIWNRSLTGDEIRWLYEQQGMLDYIDTNDLLLEYYNRDEDRYLNGTVGVKLHTHQDVGFTNNGTGYVEPRTTGERLGQGRVTAHVQSFFGIDYDVIFKLPSGSDFIQVDVEE